MSKRTQKDEDNYNAELRRSNPIMCEVIVELKNDNKNLRANQARLLAQLIEAQDSLRVYREQVLAHTKRCIDAPGDCVPGCTKHRWDTVDGWRHHDRGRTPQRDTRGIGAVEGGGQR
jgi:hypothetical protein